MKLFLISQTVNISGAFESAIVSAPNEEYARQMTPCPKVNAKYLWCAPEQVEVSYIGEASDKIVNAEVLLASYNFE